MDSDPAFRVNADPDPTFYFYADLDSDQAHLKRDADPDSAPYQRNADRIQLPIMMWIRNRIFIRNIVTTYMS